MAKGLELVITGDAKGALTALKQVDLAAGSTDGSVTRHGTSMGRSFDDVSRRGGMMGTNVSRAAMGIGTAVAAGGVAVGAAAVGIGVALYQIGSSFDEVYDNIQIKTGASGDRMNELKDVFRNVADDSASSLGDIGTALANLEVRLPSLSDAQLGAATSQFADLARILDMDVGAAVEGATQTMNMWGLSTESLPSMLDMLFRATQESGIGFDELQGQLTQFAPTLQEMGFSFGDSVAMLSEFERSGVDASGIMSGLNRGLRTFAQEGEAPADAFRRMVAGIQDGSIGLDEAFQIFGRGAAPMFNAIRQGRFDFEDMGAAILDNQNTIEDTADSTADFGERWQEFKNNAMLGLEGAGTAVFDFAGQVGEMARDLGPVVRDLLDDWGPTFQQISDDLLPRLQEAFDGITEAVRDNWPQISETIQEIMGEVQETVSAFVETAAQLWDWFGADWLDSFRGAIGPIVQMIGGIYDVIHNVVQLVLAVVRGDWSEAWEALKGIVGGVVDFVLGAVGLLWNGIKSWFELGVGAVGNLWNAWWEMMKAAPGAAWNLIVGVVRTNFEIVKSVFSSAGQVISNIWSGIWGGVRDYLARQWTGLVGMVRGMVAAIGSVWGGIKSIFASVANWVIDNVINAFIRNINRVADAIGVNVSLGEIGRIGGSGGGVQGAEERRVYHTGGVVAGRVGEEVGATLQAGEGVLPISAMRNMSPHQFELLRQGKTDAIGDGLGWSTITDTLSAAAGGVADAVRSVIANVARPAINAALGLLDGLPFPGKAGDLIGGAARWLGDKVLDWIEGADHIAKTIVPPLGPGVGWQAMWDALHKKFPWAQLFSGLRPGAITATGNTSMHSKGRAIDVTPSMEIFDWIASSFGANNYELIFSPANGRQLYRGRPHMYGEPTRGDHWDHVHWSMDDGGFGTTPGSPTMMHIGSKVKEDFAFVPHSQGGLAGLGSTVVVNVDLRGARIGRDGEQALREIEEGLANGKALGPTTKKLLGVG